MAEVVAFRSPPGYPLFYVEEKWTVTCSGCGASRSFSLLFTHERYGSVGSKGRKTFAGEKIYDLPIKPHPVNVLTARCERCIDSLPREAVPLLPPLRSPTGRSTRMKAEALAAASQRKTLDDFDFT